MKPAFAFSVLAALSFLVGCFPFPEAGPTTLAAVDPHPNVVVVGTGTYSVDVRVVPDVVEPGRGVTIQQVRATIQRGFVNAVGSAYRPDPTGAIRLVFEDLGASIDEGRYGVMRIRYRARWEATNGDIIARTAGTALPKNPAQTGSGHWRDTVEVMLEQLVDAFNKAQPSEHVPAPIVPAPSTNTTT
jgi:hypothetical protein